MYEVCDVHNKPIEVTTCPFTEEIYGETKECDSCCEECIYECAQAI